MAPETGSAPAALTANAFTRTGYTFAGWNTAADGSGTAYADRPATPSAPRHPVRPVDGPDLYRHLRRQRRHRHDGPGTGSAPAALTANAFTRTGYTFAGWNTAADGSARLRRPASYPFSASVTLYAQWTVPTYTVTFDANGGTGSMSHRRPTTTPRRT